MTPKEKAIKNLKESLFTSFWTKETSSEVLKSIDIALQEQIRIDEEKRKNDIEQIFDDCLRECNDKKSYDRILELKQKRVK